MSSASSPSSSPVDVPAPAVKETKAKTTKKAAATQPKVAKKAATKQKSGSKAASSHPTWKEIIKECIVTTGGRKGVSRSALKNFAEEQYKLEVTAAHISQLNRAITSGVESGMFVLPKGPSGCVKLAPKTPRDSSKENAKPASKTSAGKTKAPAKNTKALLPPRPNRRPPMPRRFAVVGTKAAPKPKKSTASKPHSATKKVAAAA
ncbi:Histone H1 [Mycena venus]|uniref:Histone H1 n=1 Tax=Mycena venus TaxID=2733690 RepID=A0A8H6XBU8_9AGAR|nr:Histone H1 [Mycena venus]